MSERQYLEAEIVVTFEGEHIYFGPLSASAEHQRAAVAAGAWAEVLIPYHPEDESQPVYGFVCYIEGKPHDEIAVLEMLAIEQHVGQLYEQFRDFARDPLEDAQ